MQFYLLELYLSLYLKKLRKASVYTDTSNWRSDREYDFRAMQQGTFKRMMGERVAAPEVSEEGATRMGFFKRKPPTAEAAAW